MNNKKHDIRLSRALATLFILLCMLFGFFAACVLFIKWVFF